MEGGKAALPPVSAGCSIATCAMPHVSCIFSKVSTFF